jgi:hypothetical protein
VDLSFQEKSLWLMLLSLLLGFGVYAAMVLPAHAANVMPHQIVQFVVAVVALVVMQIVGHIVIAIFDRRAESDERDRLIALKGTRNAGYVLAVGVFFALCTALVTDGNFMFTHVLLAAWVLAQLVEIASQLVLYRRGS